MAAIITERLLAEAAEPGRECGPCTVCCTLLAETELRKPMRCACEHVRRTGCGIYDTRPTGCQEFHCLWLRGALPADIANRPDQLGVMFDGYRPRGSEAIRLVALEVWNEAFEGPMARAQIDSLAALHELELSRRDGSWRTMTPEVASFATSAATGSIESSSGIRGSSGSAGAS